ncbi:MAG: hypothetical protein F4146_02240 [Rhodothermaceae bacterium]|nr:hypothetical protein [Rhodothermaceae bacterium]MYF39611.1 hypothetical protein [Rhodothermaceae bacterium]MYH07383.1 hypothetical protein [Rhodothermaceae bacterium]
MKQCTANDYGSRAVKAAHRVLIELTQVLDQYEEHTAIVGGWVPPLLMPHSRHIGSIDVDLAIDHEAIQGAPFGPIRKLLEQSVYYPDGKRAFIFHRDVELNDGGTLDEESWPFCTAISCSPPGWLVSLCQNRLPRL